MEGGREKREIKKTKLKERETNGETSPLPLIKGHILGYICFKSLLTISFKVIFAQPLSNFFKI